MDFSKALKDYHIAVMSELPPKGIKVEIGTVVAIPSEKQGQLNLYTWYNDEWVFTSSINMSDFELEELKNACDDLENALKKLNKVSSNSENEELSSKLSKITSKILQTKYELIDDVLGQFERN